MSNLAIYAEGLGKRYTLGQTFERTLSGRLGEIIRGKWKNGTRGQEEFWALSDVSFEVKEGEVVGILGGNGAGKSTLLKLLSRISAPTTGRALVQGRMSSLLEVGTGFHPELTGRENIFLNGAILGMRRSEVLDRFDKIVEFSGLEKFIDTPVKRYSSGMYMRLAFSVAAHLEPDILVVDEVLAVGDADFQKRCLGKMSDVAHGGRTVLFVSHNMTALRNLCSRGILLRSGKVECDADIDEALASYARVRSGGIRRNEAQLVGASCSGEASIRRVSVSAVGKGIDEEIRLDDRIRIEIEVANGEANVEVAPFIHLHDSGQVRVLSSGAFFNADLVGRRLDRGFFLFTCDVPARVLNSGEYSLDVMLVKGRKHVIASEPSLVAFHVQDEPLGIEGWHWHPVGVLRPALDWRLAE